MNKNEIENILSEIHIDDIPRWEFVVTTPGILSGCLLQFKVYRQDNATGEYEWGGTEKSYVPPHSTKSEVIQKALALTLRYREHQGREAFLYRGRSIYGPHFDADALWAIAKGENRQ